MQRPHIGREKMSKNEGLKKRLGLQPCNPEQALASQLLQQWNKQDSCSYSPISKNTLFPSPSQRKPHTLKPRSGRAEGSQWSGMLFGPWNLTLLQNVNRNTKTFSSQTQADYHRWPLLAKTTSLESRHLILEKWREKEAHKHTIHLVRVLLLFA